MQHQHYQQGGILEGFIDRHPIPLQETHLWQSLVHNIPNQFWEDQRLQHQHVCAFYRSNSIILELRPIGTKSINNEDYKASVKSLLILLKVSKNIPTTYNKDNYFVRILKNGINLNIESLLVWRQYQPGGHLVSICVHSKK